VRLTAIKVDLDVDSDNNNGLNTPDRSDGEDLYEDKAGDPDHPGKFVQVNDGDKDNDGIPDFADGFNAFGPASYETAGEQFTPLVLEIPACIDATKAKIRITYDGSRLQDPCNGCQVTRTGEEPNYTYTPEPGKLRIWKCDGSRPRNPYWIGYDMNGGDFVESGTAYAASLLRFQEYPVQTVYIEGIRASTALGDCRILVEVDPGGSGDYMVMDAVRVTVAKVDLDVDSDNNNGMNSPDRSDVEDLYEDKAGDPDHPGKFVMVNDVDKDNDGIPDFADGFGAFGNDSYQTEGEQFTPLVLEIPACVDPARAKIVLNYDGSRLQDLNSGCQVTRTGVAPNYTYTPEPGKLRIWNCDGSGPRSPYGIDNTSLNDRA
jgi:hypothetical protein